MFVSAFSLCHILCTYSASILTIMHHAIIFLYYYVIEFIGMACPGMGQSIWPDVVGDLPLPKGT